MLGVRHAVEDDRAKPTNRRRAANKLKGKRSTMASATDQKIAKESRLRLFKDERERAMKQVAEDAIAVRQNMARLRELRLEKEAETASVRQAVTPDGLAKPLKRRLRRRIY
jgi:hypothetical protein